MLVAAAQRLPDVGAGNADVAQRARVHRGEIGALAVERVDDDELPEDPAPGQALSLIHI